MICNISRIVEITSTNMRTEVLSTELIFIQSVAVGVPQGSVLVDEKALLASCRVTFRVAKAGKPHTDAENLILPAALDRIAIMLDKQDANKLKSISLSDNTIERRINDMTGDIREQLAENLKKNPHFALQFDESTDVLECAQFIAFVRFEADETIMEDFVFY
ncbi:protein FAM200A-like [Schistocerca gregaria]|uniref:protein FAM200A-like n=1 Tax=Schistocerca gregaria TaxID=7010 RepID=UPI00211DD21A|nr:protein FAM200A-like [Schistocerca gregaria]